MTTPGEQFDATLTAMQKATDRLNSASDRLQSLLDAGATPAPAPEPPDVTTPPEVPGKLPVRVGRGPIEHQSASNFIVRSPRKNGKSTAGLWLDPYPRRTTPREYDIRNGEISGYGPAGGSSRDQGIYLNNGVMRGGDIHIYGPTARNKWTHAIYCNGSEMHLDRLMIGSPDDAIPHDISINIDKGDETEHKPRPVTIDTLLVYGGWRNVIENTPGTVSKLTIGKMIVVDPVTADGLWEGIEVDGCEVAIGDYIVIDTGGRWKSGAMLKAKNCTGEVKRARVATANSALEMGDLIRGVGYTLAGHAIPRTLAPAWTLDNFDKLVEHYGGAG
jgi:hypothetical protein